MGTHGWSFFEEILFFIIIFIIGTGAAYSIVGWIDPLMPFWPKLGLSMLIGLLVYGGLHVTINIKL